MALRWPFHCYRQPVLVLWQAGSATSGSIVVRDVHVQSRRLRLAPTPALHALELIDVPAHVALDGGLVTLDALEFEALRNAQPLPGDLKIGSFLFLQLSLVAIQIL